MPKVLRKMANSSQYTCTAPAVLILEHKNVANGLFASSFRDTGIENDGDASANTYSIIGALNAEEWRRADGRFWFEMVYKNNDGSTDTLTWAQESWLTESIIVGADLFGVPKQTVTDSKALFSGLGLSSASGSTYLDGDGGASGWYYNSVGTVQIWNNGIPAFNEKIAYGVSLYILVDANKTYMGFSTEMDMVDWDTSSWKCVARGGRLATFSGSVEFRRLQAFHNAMGVSAWMGIKYNKKCDEGDDPCENCWNCVAGGSIAHDVMLSAASCYGSRSYICEITQPDRSSYDSCSLVSIVPDYQCFGVLSAKDVVIVLVCVLNLLLLAAFVWRARKAPKVQYAKCVTDTD